MSLQQRSFDLVPFILKKGNQISMLNHLQGRVYLFFHHSHSLSTFSHNTCDWFSDELTSSEPHM